MRINLKGALEMINTDVNCEQHLSDVGCDHLQFEVSELQYIRYVLKAVNLRIHSKLRFLTHKFTERPDVNLS